MIHINNNKRSKRGLATDLRIVARAIEAKGAAVLGHDYINHASPDYSGEPDDYAVSALGLIARKLEHGGNL